MHGSDYDAYVFLVYVSTYVRGKNWLEASHTAQCGVKKKRNGSTSPFKLVGLKQNKGNTYFW